MYQSKRNKVSFMKKRVFDPKNTFLGFSQIKNGSRMKIEKRKTLNKVGNSKFYDE